MPVATTELRFDVYGRFVVVLSDDGGAWWTTAVVGSDGKRFRLPELAIPLESDTEEIVDHLDTVYHELARPGDLVTRLDG